MIFQVHKFFKAVIPNGEWQPVFGKYSAPQALLVLPLTS